MVGAYSDRKLNLNIDIICTSVSNQLNALEHLKMYVFLYM